MFNFIRMVTGLMPPDTDDPKAMKLYHRHNSIALTIVVAALSVVLMAMFYTLPQVIGGGSLAWAGEIDTKIDLAMAAKLKPVNDKLQELAKKQETQGDILKELATASLREDICRYAARRLLERDLSERARLLGQIEIMKQKYLSYSGQSFNTADC